MPYLKSKNLLYIHIPKTGGKSIELAFKFVGQANINNQNTRNFINLASRFFLNSSKSKLSYEKLHGPIDYVFIGQHLSILEITKYNFIPKAKLNSAIVFSVVRNPYDRAVSTYGMFSDHGGSTDSDLFYEFWRKFMNYQQYDHNILAHTRTQSHFLKDENGVICVKNLLRFENLENDVREFGLKIGMGDIVLSHQGRNPNRKSFEEYFDSKSYALINRIFAEDFQNFGYAMYTQD